MDTLSPIDDSHNDGIRATSTSTRQDTDVSMIRAALSDLVAPAAVTQTMRCCLCGAHDTLILQYTEAERQILLAGRPDPLDTWFCGECHEMWRAVGIEVDAADGDREVFP